MSCNKTKLIKRLFKLSDLSLTPSRKRVTVLLVVGGYANTAITIAQGLLLVPLYLQFMGARIYGLWLASGGILGMLMLMNFGIGSMLIQRISREYGQKNLAQAGAYFINGMIVYLCICLLYGLVGLGASYWLPSVLKVDGDDARLLRQCFQLAVLAMTIGIFNECLRSLSQALLRPVFTMTSMIIGRILGISVTIWMLFDNFGLWSIPMGLLISESIILILNIFNANTLFRQLGTTAGIDKNIVQEYLRVIPALFTAKVGTTLSQESEPLLITLLISPEVTTAYMVSRRAADIVLQMLSVITGSIMGSFSHLAGSNDRKKTNSIAIDFLVLVFSLGVIGFATYVGVNHAFVSLWVGESLAMDQNTILFIGFGFFALSFRNLLWQLLNSLGNFIYTSIVIQIEGITRIALTTLALSTIGVIGVPLACAFSCLITILVFLLHLKRTLLMSFNFPAIAKFLFSGVLLFGISISLTPMDITSWANFTLKIVLLLGGMIAVYMMIHWRYFLKVYKSTVSKTD